MAVKHSKSSHEIHKHHFLHKVKTAIVGHPHNPHDNRLFHKLSLIAFFAWVGLGADALSSSSYGPEEAFLALHGHIYLGIFVALASAITIFVISASYSQIIEEFPSGGGGYVVASNLLSPVFGMISGSALIIDYVLTITISIAAGAAAIFSFFPLAFQPLKLWFAVGALVFLMIINLRGVKESIVPLVPIFVTFVVTHAFIIAYALLVHPISYSQLAAATVTETQGTFLQLGFLGALFLILHAYSMGAGTYTGIEAVSNGMSILRRPRVKTAKRTMRYMAVSLAFTAVGLMLAYLFYHVTPVAGKTLNAVLFTKIAAQWGTYGYFLILISLLSEAALLAIAAQTGFFGGPRVLANMAVDHWLPTRFAALSDRFIIRNGVILMGISALIMMLLTRGSITFLVVLYSINVFITFVLAQLGMVKYWLKASPLTKGRYKKLFINGFGLVLSAFILLAVTILKFNEGGWITLLITGALIGVVLLIKKHYNSTSRLIKNLDSRILSSHESLSDIVPKTKRTTFNPKSKTAVILVRGFNGIGIHTLKNITHTFKHLFKNFVFVEIGAIDAGNFKGTKELEHLKMQTKREVNRYVNMMQAQGYYAEGYFAIGIDVVNEVSKMTPKILKRFPKSTFFGGQIVFPKESFFNRLLHNYTLFAVQRRLYNQGITVVVLPFKI